MASPLKPKVVNYRISPHVRACLLLYHYKTYVRRSRPSLAEPGHVEYDIETTIENEDGKQEETVAVKRRFREFDQLKNKLQESADDLPGIPSKLFNTSPDKRQPKLDSFLKEVVDNVAPTKNTIPVELAEFLGIEKIVTNKKKADDGLKVSYGTPLVNDKFKSLLDHCVSEMFAQSTECEASPFVLVGTQDPWKWYARAAKDGKEAARVVKGTLKAPARFVHELFLDLEACKELEPNIASAVQVQEVDAHTNVQYFVMKSIMMMPQRDVILCRHWRVLEDGCIVHCEVTLEEFAGCPRAGEGGLVRAVMTVGGAIIRPIDLTSCAVVRVNNMDPKLGDAVPAWALAKVNEFTCSMLANNMITLQKVVKRRGMAEVSKVISKGPLVNHNGAVSGSVNLANVEPVAEEAPRESAWKQAMVDHQHFLLGFLLGLIAFVCFHYYK